MADTTSKVIPNDDSQENANFEISANISPTSGHSSAEEQDNRDREEVTADIAAFLNKYNPVSSQIDRQDVLNDRYVLHPYNELTEFSNEFAVACEAQDEIDPDQKLYALILQHDMPYRMKNLKTLAKIEHPNLLKLQAFGTVSLSENNNLRQAVVLEMPTNRSIRNILETKKNPFIERYVIEEIIGPITQILQLFRQNGISHGRINIDTVYLDDKVMLGESVSEPAGFSQHYHFESTERYQADPLGKGEPTTAADCYALGILVAHMVLGLNFFERIDKDSFLSRRLILGTYNILLGGRDYANLEDFFKGVLNDDPLERWTPDQIAQWVAGKKFNLLTPSVLREGQRPYSFKEEDFFNRRALANSFAQNWEEAQMALRSGHLSRWVEVSLHKNEMASALRKVMERTGGIQSGSDKANNELVARSIALLDPEGPVRYNGISSFADGLGLILANAFRKQEQLTIHTIIEMIDYNFFNFSKDGGSESAAKTAALAQAKFVNCSRYLRIPAMGFGIERVLYELNPNLPCQSTLLSQDDVLTTQQLLEAIDRFGTRSSKGLDYLDRHIAAFVATKIDLDKEVKLSEFRVISALSANPQLVVLYMLHQAQKKLGKPKLKGLSSWAVLRVLPLVDHFHSRTIKRKIRANLRSAARSGELERIFDALTEASAVNQDTVGFQKAMHRYSKNERMIEKLRNKSMLKEKSRHIGIIVAGVIAYSALLLTIAITFKNFYF